MLTFLGRRLLATVALLFFVSLVVFLLVHALPGDPALLFLGEEVDKDTLVKFRARLGFDRPLPLQYAEWLGGAVRGDLGRSLRTNQPVTSAILERMPATMELAAAAMLVALTFAIPLGIVAAVWRGTAVDHAATTVSLLGSSIPNFWLGPLLA